MVTTGRIYSSRRYAIVAALVELFKTIDGTGSFRSKVNNSVYPNLKYFDEVVDFPAICVTAAYETRNYQTGGYRDRFLDVRIMLFINEENPLDKCEALMEDVESLIEENGRLAYIDRDGATQYTQDITISSLSSDEGTLDPMSVGEINIRVQY
jgi:hypothetical protein